MGLGHVMRSLALGEGLVALGWRVILATRDAPRGVVDAAQAAMIEVHEASASPGSPEDAEELVSLGPDIAVVDGYRNGRGFFNQLGRLGCPHAVIDDNVETNALDPDVVVNQNPHACAEMYGAFPRAELLLGLGYALLRREVREHAPPQAPAEQPRRPKVLISMGGSDPLGLTIPLMRALRPLDCDIRIAVGPANVRATEVRSEIEVGDGATEVAPDEFLDALAGCAVGVVGAGSILWEAAFLGVPTIAVIVADNQSTGSTRAEALGFTRTIDARTTDAATAVAREVTALLADPRRRAAMSHAGRKSVDGRGVERVSAALAALVGARQR